MIEKPVFSREQLGMTRFTRRQFLKYSGVSAAATSVLSLDDVASAAIRLLQNPELAREMGARGRQWIIDEWRWERWAAEFNALLIEDQPFAQR